MNLEEAVATLDLPTSNDVAELLRENNITGYRGSVCSCPIANYLSNLCNRKVVVDGKVAKTYFPPQVVTLPSSAFTFIHDFDNSLSVYGDLVPPL